MDVSCSTDASFRSPRRGVNVLTFALVGERTSNNFIAENGIRDTSKWPACVWVVPTAAKADHNANGDKAGWR